MHTVSQRKLARFLLCAVLGATASSAQAALTITNGNFETFQPPLTTGNVAGVYQWFNAQNLDNPNTAAVDPAPWYFNVSQATAVSPTGTASLVMTGNHDPAGGVPIPWIYQSIGMNTEGLTTLPLQFDLGGFTDNNPISAHIDVQLFKGTGFVGADNADIVGAAGVTQVGTTFSVERLSFAGNSGVINVPVDFDLTGVAPTDELFVRFQSIVPTGWTGSNYVRLDNIKIRTVLPPPKAVKWVGLPDGGTWDDNTSAHWTTGSGAATFGPLDTPTFDDTAAVNGSNATVVNVVSGFETGNVVINNTAHDYVFQGGGRIAGGPGATLVKQGTGKVTFANVGGSSFQGGYTIEAGTVELTGNTDTDSHGLAGGPIVNNGTIILNRTYASATATNEWNPLFVRAALSGSGAVIIKNHAFMGQENAGGAPATVNTFTGPVTIEGGFTYLGDVTGLGSPTVGTTVLDGATLAVVDIWHLGDNATIAEPLTLNGLGAVTWFNSGNPSGALFGWQGTRTFTGQVHLASTTAINPNKNPFEAGVGVDPLSHFIFTMPITAAPGATLMKMGEGSLQLAGGTVDALQVYGGTVKLSAGTLKVKSLSVEATLSLDVGDGALVVDYDGSSPYGDIKAMTAAEDGRLKATRGTYVLGIVDTGLTPIGLTFAGVDIDGSAVLARATLRGDANLDLNVGFPDLLTLAQNYGTSSNITWGHGDFDNDGQVNFSDLLALAQNYGGTVTGTFAGDWALAQSLVPEPSTALAVSTLGLAALRRRNRRSAVVG